MNTFTRWETERFVTYPVLDILIYDVPETPAAPIEARKALTLCGCSVFEEQRHFDIRSDKALLRIKGYRLGEAIQ